MLLIVGILILLIIGCTGYGIGNFIENHIGLIFKIGLCILVLIFLPFAIPIVILAILISTAKGY